MKETNASSDSDCGVKAVDGSLRVFCQFPALLSHWRSSLLTINELMCFCT